MSDNFIFQNDNDPKHTGRAVKQFFQEENINVLPWSSQSPDINPIENLWSLVKKTIHDCKPKNLDGLYFTIETAWNNITVDQCEKLIDSMPKGYTEMIKNNGYWTKY